MVSSRTFIYTDVSIRELSATALAVKLNRMIQDELDMVINKTVFWTDSMSFLQFINNASRRFHTFVENRLSIIHEGSTPNQWKYVESKLNPAESATRGLPSCLLSPSDQVRPSENSFPPLVPYILDEI